MFVRRGLVLLALMSSACAVFAGCAEDTTIEASDDPPKEDDVVSARQLNGSDMPDKTISLTLDDGPGERTGELAEYLAQQGVRATFFINGKNAGPRGLAAIDKIVSNGHILANHTQNHKQLTSLSSAAVEDEVAKTDAIIARAQPNGPWLLRAPFGAWSSHIAENLNAGPMRKYTGSVFWDEGGELTAHTAADWACWGRANVSVKRCGELYIEEVHAKKRGIILMHDIHNKTVDMIKQVVPALKADGYTFVGLDEAPSVKRALGAASGLGRAPGLGGEGDDGAVQ